MLPEYNSIELTSDKNIFERVFDCTAISKNKQITTKLLPKTNDMANEFSIFDQTVVTKTALKVSNKINEEIYYTYKPRTIFGAKLMEIRNSYIKSGGKLLDENELRAEFLAIRRGLIDE